MYRGYVFGKGSLSHINTTTGDMQRLCHRAMEIANTRKIYCPDWGVTCGKRTKGEQLGLFMQGRAYHQLKFKWEVVAPSKVITNCDGHNTLSVHQSGDAVDIYVVGEDKYDNTQLALVIVCFFEAADDLELRIDSGMSFKSISDACHIEIVR